MSGGKKPMNHNVRLSLVFSALSGASNGVWGWQVLAMYLFVLTGGSNAKVGLCEGIQGAFKAAAALPAGVLADRWRRDLILRASAAVAVVAIAVTSFALLWSSSERNEYIAICVGCTLWGIFNGLSSPALEAIFADSCPTGDRSRMYVRAPLLAAYCTSAFSFFYILTHSLTHSSSTCCNALPGTRSSTWRACCRSGAWGR